MRAMIDFEEPEPTRWIKAAKLRAGIEQGLQVRLAQLRRPQTIDNDVHFDARASALGQGLNELRTHLTRAPDVLFDGDRLPRLTNGLEHRGKDLVSIEQHSHPVSLHKRRAQ